MNILIVTQYFWPEEFRINDLALGLAMRGHRVRVLTGKPNYPSGRFFPGYGFFRRASERYEGIDVVRVPLIPRGRGGGFRLAANYVSFATAATLAAPFRCPGGYDVILVFEPSPITVGIPARVLRAIKRTPVLFWVQDLWPESLEATGAVRRRWLIDLAERLTRFIYRGCDRVLVQSRAFIEPIMRLGVPAERIAYFPNSAEPFYEPIVLPPEAPERKRIPPGFIVMFAGNLGAAQDFGTILAAAELLKHDGGIHVVVLGEGRLSEWVRDEIGKRGLYGRMHLLGRHPVASMPRWFSLADAMLVTLRRETIFEYTIPSKIQSYMACGRAIIAGLDGEGARIVTEAGAGYAVPAEDPQALADAIRALASRTRAERETMGAAGRRYFEQHFDRDMLLRRLEDWMLELRRSRDIASV
ncbi:MAG: glycosyltransferase family 4 protein [Burkholderiales bacterium]|nr:glycosyltransferase family 4 protein [Burkholderiales bacterium]